MVKSLKSKFMSFSLKTQLLLILFFLLIGSLTSLTIIYSRTEDLIIQKITENIDDLTKAIQISVEELTYRGDSTTRLKAYVDTLNKKGIKEISIISDRSEVIASSNPKKVGHKETIDEKIALADFSPLEFKSRQEIERLCIEISNLNLPYQLSSQANTIDWLNELLRIPDLWSFVLSKEGFAKIPKETKDYIEKLKKSYEESKSERDLVRLNRFVLEEFFPNVVPKRVRVEKKLKKDLFIVARLGEEGKKETQRPYNVIMPVSVKGKHLGYIHISMVLDDYKLIQKRNHIKRVIATLSIFAIGAILCLFLAEKYTRPIKEIAEASKSIIEGNLKKIERTERKDEIGTLIESYNEMIEKMTERKRLEERLKESERLSLIGQISSGIAHEIRNPLNFISLSVSHVKETILEKEFKEKDEIVYLLESVMNEIKKVNELIHNFLFLGKGITLKKERIEIKTLVEEALYLLKDKFKNGIEVKVAEKEETVLCDKEYMRLSLLNLILNAIEALEEKGAISIDYGREDSMKYITICDNGVGIDKDSLEKVFEPYFSTKKFGIGLGLTLAKRFVNEHGGEIKIESEPKKGTKVMILLPDYEG
ncbi:MAG: ATP-binding protein [Desulfobacterota bacterium]|nr:ATP-binding protein [Thermodesulfobacteriota bacterium]